MKLQYSMNVTHVRLRETRLKIGEHNIGFYAYDSKNQIGDFLKLMGVGGNIDCKEKQGKFVQA
jgi:hypothetical protein